MYIDLHTRTSELEVWQPSASLHSVRGVLPFARRHGSRVGPFPRTRRSVARNEGGGSTTKKQEARVPSPSTHSHWERVGFQWRLLGFMVVIGFIRVGLPCERWRTKAQHRRPSAVPSDRGRRQQPQSRRFDGLEVGVARVCARCVERAAKS